MSQVARPNVSRIYIDSRCRQPGGTPSDFVYEPAETIVLPEKCYAWMTEATVGAIHNVTSSNNKIYFSEGNTSASDPITCKIVEVPVGQYATPTALANAIVTAMNAQKTYSTFSAAVDLNRISITATGDTAGTKFFRVFAENNLQTHLIQTAFAAVGNTYNPNNLMSLNSVAGNMHDDTDPNDLFMSTAPQVFPGRVNIVGFGSVYIHSPTLVKLGNVLGPQKIGGRTILKKIPIQDGVTFNSVFLSEGKEYIDLSGVRSISRMEFSVRDTFGNLIDLTGSFVSFTLVLGVPTD